MKFKLIICTLFLLISANPACSENTTQPDNDENNDISSPPGYELFWSDEFNGAEISVRNWNHETGGWGWGNNELQYYTDRDENSYIEDGDLVIVAKEETYENRDYTSARMTTQNKRFFKYGWVEARIKLPYGQGIWPAFWMLGQNISQIGWPACGEIDIMEMIGGGEDRDDTAHGTAHWDANGHQFQGGHIELSGNQILAEDYHVFAVEWDSTQINWYMDGTKYYTFEITSDEKSEFHNDFFIILNVAVGGNWPGSPNLSTKFPQQMRVDYVRVFQREE